MGIDDPNTQIRVQTLKSKLHTDEVEIQSEDFDELYQEVAEIDEHDLEYLNDHWNPNATNPMKEFADREIRGIEIGDIVEKKGDYYICLPKQWLEINITE